MGRGGEFGRLTAVRQRDLQQHAWEELLGQFIEVAIVVDDPERITALGAFGPQGFNRIDAAVGEERPTAWREMLGQTIQEGTHEPERGVVKGEFIDALRETIDPRWVGYDHVESFLGADDCVSVGLGERDLADLESIREPEQGTVEAGVQHGVGIDVGRDGVGGAGLKGASGEEARAGADFEHAFALHCVGEAHQFAQTGGVARIPEDGGKLGERQGQILDGDPSDFAVVADLSGGDRGWQR